MGSNSLITFNSSKLNLITYKDDENCECQEVSEKS